LASAFSWFIDFSEVAQITSKVSSLSPSTLRNLCSKKEGREEGRKGGREEGREEGRKGGTNLYSES